MKFKEWILSKLFTKHGASSVECQHVIEDCRLTGEHSWTDLYDNTTYPGATRIVDSYCMSCGLRQQGSGQ